MSSSPCGTHPTVKEQPYSKNSFVNGPEESEQTVMNIFFFPQSRENKEYAQKFSVKARGNEQTENL